jgi:leucine dehydrogenase
VADVLHRAGVLWVPDHVVGAGGIIGAVHREHRGGDDASVLQEVAGIARTTREVLSRAAREGRAPHRAAMEMARERVASSARPVSRTSLSDH